MMTTEEILETNRRSARSLNISLALIAFTLGEVVTLILQRVWPSFGLIWLAVFTTSSATVNALWGYRIMRRSRRAYERDLEEMRARDPEFVAMVERMMRP